MKTARHEVTRWLAIVFCSVAAFSLATPQGTSDPTAQLKEARGLYNSGKFDKAITLLTKLAENKSIDKNNRREVLMSLGRSYFAKRQKEKAEWALSQLLDLEPPFVELNPDAECHEFMSIYYDVRKKKTGSTSIERADPGIKTIAILDFKNRSVSDDAERFNPMEKGFPELMISQLKETINLKVVERERIQWLLDEIGMENDPSKFDVNSAVRVGKLLGVQSVLLGSFIKFKDEMRLLARLVKTETGEIIATDQVSGDADEFFELAEKLGSKLAKKIDVAVSEAQLEKGTPTKSLDAMMAYSEGLVLLEKGSYTQAYEKFQQAITLDPNYEKAKVKIESLKPLIG